MKKLFIFFAAVFAMTVSCQQVNEERSESAVGGVYKFDFNIAAGGFDCTKGDATVGWTAGEKVFVFFKPSGSDLCSTGYAEFTCCTDGSWTSESTLKAGDLGSAGQMAAVYVPFFSGAPVYSSDQWTIDGGDVYYACASGAEYAVKDGVVYGTLDMKIPDGYVQLAIDATEAAAEDKLTCNLMDARECVTLNASLEFTDSAVSGNEMTGHEYNGKIYFWGRKNEVVADLCEFELTTADGITLTQETEAANFTKNASFNLKRMIEGLVVEYGDVKYHAIRIGDNYWFTENLRYVPAGYTVSSDYLNSTNDKAQCIFYPAKQTGVESNKVTYEAGSAANTELNEKVGLLYNIYAYLLDDNLPAATDTVAHKAYNGTQGICPDGWHIPTHEEWNTLVSYATSSEIWETATGENDKAAFYETYNYDKSGIPASTSHTSITKANESGFNFYPVGVVTATTSAPYSTAISKSPEEFKDMFGLNYFACSSVCNLGSTSTPAIKPYAVLSTMSNTGAYSHGRLAMSAIDGKYAVSVRCVKSAK